MPKPQKNEGLKRSCYRYLFLPFNEGHLQSERMLLKVQEGHEALLCSVTSPSAGEGSHLFVLSRVDQELDAHD